MEHDSTIEDYDIPQGAELHLVLRLRGGMLHRSSGRSEFAAYDAVRCHDLPLCVHAVV
jgi:hypothetical protein